MSFHILVVDDSATIRHKVSETLKSHGMEVTLARNGNEALAHLPPGHPFDVVITDLRMPGMDGDTLVATIQRCEGGVLPVLVLTAVEGKEAHVRNLQAGAAAFLNKPWDDLVLVATVMRLAEQHARQVALAHDSRTDVLTGLFNRRYGQDRLKEALSHGQRYGRPLSVVLLDIDHFKRINDTLGHQAGDDVLTQVAKALRQASRNSDAVVRWGGEEFLFIFPETDLLQATGVVDRFRATLAESPVPLRVGGSAVPVTISGGAAEAEAVDTADTLVARADEALYRAKEAGRNRLMAWQLGQLLPVAQS
ncbi:MAG: GGDEF domain-containing response regulator [Planctomycetota bacterium]